MNTASQVAPAAETARYDALKDPNGLRAGWRLLIFLAMIVPLYFVAMWIIDSVTRKLHVEPFTPVDTFIAMGVCLAALFLSTGIMAKIERRSFADYGLPWRRAFCAQFWQGAAISFISLSGLMLALRLAGALSFDSLALHGLDIWKYGLQWVFAFFLVALLEDFLYRGYILFTLTTGLGFWPAAVVSSLLMGGAHFLNPGGLTGLGPYITFIYCLVSCLVIRRTGDLWMALGIHAAWDWGITFVYGVHSGGQLTQSHLLNSSLHGPVWLTGGTFGPEAGLPNLALLLIWWFLFANWLHGVKYPHPQAEAQAQ